MSDKFDFNVASMLVQAVAGTASALDIKNEEMKKRFMALHEYFKDTGYDTYATDMASADRKMNELIEQLGAVGKHIAAYAERLADAAKK